MSNVSKGRNSYDSNLGNVSVPFFNRNVTPYPTEAGAPKFDLIPITQQKDVMINAARLHAEQEYQRIMELVSVLQKQAEQIKRRLDITDLVHAAKYDFRLAHGQTYWLAHDRRRGGTLLTQHGPNDWSSSAPDWYEYICQVKWLGDYTWIEVEQEL